MAYFPNGTAGECYMSRFCFHCKNYRDKKDGRGFGCAVWGLHILYNRETEKEKEMLDILIPMSKDGLWQEECSMFLKKKDKKK